MLSLQYLAGGVCHQHGLYTEYPMLNRWICPQVEIIHKYRQSKFRQIYVLMAAIDLKDIDLIDSTLKRILARRDIENAIDDEAGELSTESIYTNNIYITIAKKILLTPRVEVDERYRRALVERYRRLSIHT